MGSLVEICNSVYSHTPLESFGKKYYKQRYGDKRLCEECIGAYIYDVSKKLAEMIMNCVSNISMKDITKYEDDYKNEAFNIELHMIAGNYMEYLLPINYKLNINLSYSEYYKNNDPDITSISNAISNKREKYGRVYIYSQGCPEKYNPFNFSLEIMDTDTADTIVINIEKYLTAYINMNYNVISDGIVQTIMDNQNVKIYNSNSSNNCACSAATSAVTPGCTKCNGSIYSESYLYQNNQYCLDCMYGIVVESTIDNNLTDIVGISIDQLSNNTAIVNSVQWKRSVIDRYINAMISYGVNPNIIHYQMTITG